MIGDLANPCTLDAKRLLLRRPCLHTLLSRKLGSGAHPWNENQLWNTPKKGEPFETKAVKSEDYKKFCSAKDTWFPGDTGMCTSWPRLNKTRLGCRSAGSENRPGFINQFTLGTDTVYNII